MTGGGTPHLPAQPPRRTASGVARLTAFSDHIGLKAIAGFLAVVLWFVVNAKEPDIELIPVRFTPVLDSSLVLREPMPQVQAIVAGSPRELLKLNSSLPTIRREITAQSPDTLVIDLRPEDVLLPAGVDAVVREIEPRSVTLRFESTWSRRVAVQSAIDITSTNGAPGAIAQIEPTSVEVTGPRHLVARIPFVKTIRTTIAFPDSLPHLVDLDTLALGPGVRVRPAQVKVMLMLAGSKGSGGIR
ncbi:MAG: CdaR family protein [bacterium]